MSEVRADPGKLARMAQLCLAQSEALREGLTAQREALQVPDGAFGHSAVAHQLERDYAEYLQLATLVVDRFAGVLEEEMSGLYQTAFTYRKAEQTTHD